MANDKSQSLNSVQIPIAAKSRLISCNLFVIFWPDRFAAQIDLPPVFAFPQKVR